MNLSQPLFPQNTLNYALIALGSNATSHWGSPAEMLHLALRNLASVSVKVECVSRFFSTPAFPAGAGADYVNAAAEIATDLGPEALLEHLHGVEAALGRVRGVRWGARGIDIDLLAWNAAVLPERETYDHWRKLPLAAQKTDFPPRLILPHPRLHERAFVLVPLAEVAPDWRHPVLGQTVTEMLAGLPAEDRAQIRPLEPE